MAKAKKVVKKLKPQRVNFRTAKAFAGFRKNQVIECSIEEATAWSAKGRGEIE